MAIGGITLIRTPRNMPSCPRRCSYHLLLVCVLIHRQTVATYICRAYFLRLPLVQHSHLCCTFFFHLLLQVCLRRCLLFRPFEGLCGPDVASRVACILSCMDTPLSPAYVARTLTYIETLLSHACIAPLLSTTKTTLCLPCCAVPLLLPVR